MNNSFLTGSMPFPCPNHNFMNVIKFIDIGIYSANLYFSILDIKLMFAEIDSVSL